MTGAQITLLVVGAYLAIGVLSVCICYKDIIVPKWWAWLVVVLVWPLWWWRLFA